MSGTFELATRICRDSGFLVVEHASGFTAIRDRSDDNALLLFALSPTAGQRLYWELRHCRAAALMLVDGWGLASLASFLGGAGLLNSETVANGYRRLCGPLTPIVTLERHEYRELVEAA